MWIAYTVVLVIAAAIGCGGSATQANAPSPTAPSPPAAEAPAAPEIALAPSETFDGGDYVVRGENPRVWRPNDRDVVAVAAVFDLEAEHARLVVATSGGAQRELARVTLDLAYSGSFATEVTGDALVVVLRSDGGSSDPGWIRAWRLGWDGAGRAVRVDETFESSPAETTAPAPPAWAEIGTR